MRLRTRLHPLRGDRPRQYRGQSQEWRSDAEDAEGGIGQDPEDHGQGRLTPSEPSKQEKAVEMQISDLIPWGRDSNEVARQEGDGDNPTLHNHNRTGVG